MGNRLLKPFILTKITAIKGVFTVLTISTVAAKGQLGLIEGSCWPTSCNNTMTTTTAER